MFGSSLPPVCLYCPSMSITISAYTRCSVRLYLQFVCIVLVCPLRFQHTHDVRFVFTSSLLVLSYYVRYDFSMHTMFGSSLPLVVCRRSHVLFTLFVSACAWWCPAHRALCFCFVLLCLVHPLLPVHYDFSMHTMFGSSLPLVVCRRSHVLFTLFVSACAWWCPAHRALCFCFVLLCLVHPMLPVSLDWQFVIVLSVFSNVYLIEKPI